MPQAFTSPVDIANRACQHMGCLKLTAGVWPSTDDNVQASELNFAYDKLRRAELRRNLWTFAIRKAALRPLDTTSRKLVPAVWSSTTTYYSGSIVEYPGGSGAWWVTTINENLNHTPGVDLTWDAYYGPIVALPFDSTTAYYAGELVYTFPGDGTYSIYVSISNSNTDTPATPDAWSATTTYTKDQVVSYNAVNYISLVDLNLNKEPDVSPTQWSTTIPSGVGTGSMNWRPLTTAALTIPIFNYPIGAGPSSQSETRNVYMLPAGYLRTAPQDGKQGLTQFLGAPSGPFQDDWQYEDGVITSRDVLPVPMRFVADHTQVSKMDDMFCEGLGARLALECVERVTQSNAKFNTISGAYKAFMSEARLIDSIEQGPVNSPEDPYITCRI